MRKRVLKSKNGQILILVLLIVVVSLAIGLSVAARNLTNIRITTQTELSQRAFYAAEYGIENQLYAIQQGATCSSTCISSFTPVTGGITANVSYSPQSTLQKAVVLGDVAQVNLQNPPTTGNTCSDVGNPCSFTISWTNSASLEVTLICKNTSTSAYSQLRIYLVPSSGSHTGENITASAATSVDTTVGFTKNVGCPFNQTYFTAKSSGAVGADTMNIIIEKILYSSGSSAPLYLMRIRPLYTNSTITVSGGSNTALPVQSYQISSVNDTTNTNGVTRKIQVTKSALPQLPAVFDFALYSDGPISK